MFLGVLMCGVIGEALMGEGKQCFQYIQEYTGFVSPGIFAMFILGFFWKKTTSNAALFATIGGFLLSLLFKFLPLIANLSFLAPFGFAKVGAKGEYEIPFLDRMGFVFVMCIVVMYVISIWDNKRGVKPHGLDIEKKMFKVNPSFAVGALIICGLLAALYTVFW